MQKTLFSTAGLSALALSACIVGASAATYIPVPTVTGSTETDVFSINDNNVVVGTWYDSAGGSHGFFGTLDGKYTSFDADSYPTMGRGIDNNGNITGIVPGGQCTAVPFERAASDGSFTRIHRGNTQLSGIVQNYNSGGEFVGDYCDSKGKLHGFIGENGAYKKNIAIGVRTTAPEPRGINDAEDVAGAYIDGNGNVHGFVLIDGMTTTINYPNKSAANTDLQAINNSDRAVGTWSDAKYTVFHAFEYDAASQRFQQLDPPGAKHGLAFGMNQAGLVAIQASNGSFIYCPLSKAKCRRVAAADSRR